MCESIDCSMLHAYQWNYWIPRRWEKKTSSRKWMMISHDLCVFKKQQQNNFCFFFASYWYFNSHRDLAKLWLRFFSVIWRSRVLKPLWMIQNKTFDLLVNIHLFISIQYQHIYCIVFFLSFAPLFVFNRNK